MLPQFYPQELSGLVWSYANSGFKHSTLCDAISARAIGHIAQFDAQNISNTAWSLDVLQNDTALRRYLPSALDRFREIARPTPQTTGLSWVEMHCIDAAREVDGSQWLIEGFEREVRRPVHELLQRVAVAARGAEAELDHTDAMNTVVTHAQTTVLPHLGLPATRQTLRALGVAVMPS